MNTDSERLQRWALIAEIIGGIAVVASLALVAYEIRQSTDQATLNTSALEIAAYQDLISSFSELNSLIAQDPSLAQIFVDARESPETLSDVDRQRYFRHLMSIFRHGDMAYFQYERGAIDLERLDSVMGIVPGTISRSTVAREQWDRMKFSFVESYRNHVDSRLRDESPEPEQESTETKGD